MDDRNLDQPNVSPNYSRNAYIAEHSNASPGEEYANKNPEQSDHHTQSQPYSVLFTPLSNISITPPAKPQDVETNDTIQRKAKRMKENQHYNIPIQNMKKPVAKMSDKLFKTFLRIKRSNNEVPPDPLTNDKLRHQEVSTPRTNVGKIADTNTIVLKDIDRQVKVESNISVHLNIKPVTDRKLDVPRRKSTPENHLKHQGVSKFRKIKKNTDYISDGGTHVKTRPNSDNKNVQSKRSTKTAKLTNPKQKRGKKAKVKPARTKNNLLASNNKKLSSHESNNKSKSNQISSTSNNEFDDMSKSKLLRIKEISQQTSINENAPNGLTQLSKEDQQRTGFLSELITSTVEMSLQELCDNDSHEHILTKLKSNSSTMEIDSCLLQESFMNAEILDNNVIKSLSNISIEHDKPISNISVVPKVIPKPSDDNITQNIKVNSLKFATDEHKSYNQEHIEDQQPVTTLRKSKKDVTFSFSKYISHDKDTPTDIQGKSDVKQIDFILSDMTNDNLEIGLQSLLNLIDTQVSDVDGQLRSQTCSVHHSVGKNSTRHSGLKGKGIDINTPEEENPQEIKTVARRFTSYGNLLNNITAGKELDSDSSDSSDYLESERDPLKYSTSNLMPYFCAEWASPQRRELPLQITQPIKTQSVDPDKYTLSRLEEVLNKINDNELYDVIFTYKLPKTAPFDLMDSLNEVRLKCLNKWISEKGNAIYKTLFEDELNLISGEEINLQLLNKIMSLCEQLKKCKNIHRTLSTSNVSAISSCSTYYDDEYASQLFEEEAEIEEWASGPVQLPNNSSEEDLTKLLKNIIDFINNPNNENNNKKEDEVEECKDADITANKSVSYDVGTKLAANSSSEKNRSLRELLEEVISLLQAKIKKYKVNPKGCINEPVPDKEDVATNNNFHDGCSGDELQCTRIDSTDTVDNMMDKLLLMNPRKKNTVTSNNDEVPPDEPQQKSAPKRHLLQLYLLKLRNSWTSDNTLTKSQSTFSEVEENQLLSLLEEYEANGIVEQAKEIDLSISQTESKINSTPTEPCVFGGNGSSEKIGNKLFAEVESTFTCNCHCNRISRFNPKRNEHFRPFLSENLWCINNKSYSEDKESVEVKLSETHELFQCPPEVIEEPFNFKGWLADSDRNLLLLINRPPLERLKKDYYNKQIASENIEIDNCLNDTPNVGTYLEEAVSKISKAQAENFWAAVEQWYVRYKERDAIHGLIGKLLKLDLNDILKRDIKAITDQLMVQLQATKEQIRLQVEEDQKRKFHEKVRKLKESYECFLKHQLSAKEEAMDTRTALTTRFKLLDMKENMSARVSAYETACIRSLSSVVDRNCADSISNQQQKAREIALITQKHNIAERLKCRLAGVAAKKHEKLEIALGRRLEEKWNRLEMMKKSIVNLTRDVNIWKRAVSEVLKSFKEFIQYILVTKPSRAEYLLRLERLYQLHMDDMIKSTHSEIEKIQSFKRKWNEEESREVPLLQPTMEIKCPSHILRQPSEYTVNSSSDTEIEKTVRSIKVAEHATEFIVKTVLPTPDESVIIEEGDHLSDGDLPFECLRIAEDCQLSDWSVNESADICDAKSGMVCPEFRIVGEETSDGNLLTCPVKKNNVRHKKATAS